MLPFSSLSWSSPLPFPVNNPWGLMLFPFAGPSQEFVVHAGLFELRKLVPILLVNALLCRCIELCFLIASDGCANKFPLIFPFELVFSVLLSLTEVMDVRHS